jgi:RNA polymerase sigma-32 factor
MDGRLHYQDSAFDGHQNESADDDQTLAVAPADYLADTRFEPAAQLEKTDYKQQRLNWLHSVLSELDERSRDILQRRWLSEPKATLKELATMHQVSAERIRQLEQQALKKLKAQPCAVHSA